MVLKKQYLGTIQLSKWKGSNIMFELQYFLQMKGNN